MENVSVRGRWLAGGQDEWLIQRRQEKQKETCLSQRIIVLRHITRFTKDVTFVSSTRLYSDECHRVKERKDLIC